MSPDSFDLHPVLKNVLAAIPDAEDKPITAGLLCEKLHDDEKSVISCVRELIDLGLAVEANGGCYARSGLGTKFMSLSDVEQRIFAKEHPFFHVLDLTGRGESEG